MKHRNTTIAAEPLTGNMFGQHTSGGLDAQPIDNTSALIPLCESIRIGALANASQAAIP